MSTYKLRGISLFANVGIAEAYLDSIGVDMRVANEIIPQRARFYQDVYPKTHVVCGDIKDDSIRDALVQESLKNRVNFVMATPPCQGMSMAGNRFEFDIRNELIYYAIDVIKRVNPEYALIENVPTILNTKIAIDGEVMLIPDYLKKELQESYYFNEETIARAMDYGIPQMRERNIFLLVRKDKSINWEFPTKERIVTLEEAIGDLPSLDPMLREGEKFTLQKFPDFEIKREAGAKISKWHKPPVHSWKQVEWMMHTPSGKSAIYNEVFYPQKDNGEHVVAHHNHYRRMAWDKPSRTITQNNGVISSLACVHPGRPYTVNGEILYSDPRVLSIYELLIVSSLPLDWSIPEWANDTLIRKVIGEGIPAKLIKVIMQELLKKI
ncbi:MAG: DNA cytosine methyltransferase [Bacteroidales bacterium]|nr:DNA cytosine methyltransferase [Bacteroidales bacterium]